MKSKETQLKPKNRLSKAASTAVMMAALAGGLEAMPSAPDEASAGLSPTAAKSIVDVSAIETATSSIGQSIVTQEGAQITFSHELDQTTPYEDLKPDDKGKKLEQFLGSNISDMLPGWDISYREREPGSGLKGLTFSAEKRIELYIGDQGIEYDASILAHEVGHAFDVEFLDDDKRQRWKTSRNIDESTPWWPDSGRADFATGAGDFAESFAGCFYPDNPARQHMSTVAGECSDADNALLIEFFQQAHGESA